MLSVLDLSVREWSALHSDPTKNKAYQLTGLGPSVADYLARREIEGLADRTLDTYERDLAQLCLHQRVLGKTPDEVTADDLLIVIGTFTVSQRARVRAAFRTYFDSLHGSGVIGRDPARHLPAIRGERQRIIDVFTRGEQENLKHMPHELRDRALTTLLLETGIRKAEARALTLADVSLDTRRLTIRRGKGRKGRVVVLRPTTVKVLADLFLEEGMEWRHYLWYTRYVNEYATTIKRNRSLGDGAFHRWWERMCEESGVRYRNVHVCRHTYATDMLRRKVGMRSVSKMLGHASIKTTVDLYDHMDVEEAAEEIDKAFAEDAV